MSEQDKQKELSEDIINLVIARLETLPPNIQISVGGEGSFSVEELIQGVKDQSGIGKKMVEMQLAYLRSLSNFPTQELKNAPAPNN